MSDEGDNNFVRYIYRGGEGEHIPHHATHVIVHEFTTFVRRSAFEKHPNIVEVICHEKVEQIEQEAFWCCPSLRRVIMPGVTIVEMYAFNDCTALVDVECGKLGILRQGAFSYCTALANVECGKLEMVEKYAFYNCQSLESINLPSARIVKEAAFCGCFSLADAKFGNKLERIGSEAFYNCYSLERITIPLKDGMITHDEIFQNCADLKHVDLSEGALHETIAALHLEEWRNDMNKEVDSINQILTDDTARVHTCVVEWDIPAGWDEGEKIRRWIRSVIDKINHYKAEQRRFLDDEVATTLQLALPHDIVKNNVLPFIELSTHAFEVREEEEEEGRGRTGRGIWLQGNDDGSIPTETMTAIDRRSFFSFEGWDLGEVALREDADGRMSWFLDVTGWVREI